MENKDKDGRCSPVIATPFQNRVVEWLMACFSMEVCRDGIERNHRFLEEALELVQSLDCTRSEAHQLVDYVFDRPVGDPYQELGGTLLTLTALANCHDMDLAGAGETELARVWTKIDKIRAKQAAKPKHSPLPQHVERSSAVNEQAIVFWYKNYKGEEGYRRAIPISIRYGTSDYHHSPQWLMLAFDTEKQSEREFAMSDMSHNVLGERIVLRFGGVAQPSPEQK